MWIEELVSNYIRTQIDLMASKSLCTAKKPPQTLINENDNFNQGYSYIIVVYFSDKLKLPFFQVLTG